MTSLFFIPIDKRTMDGTAQHTLLKVPVIMNTLKGTYYEYDPKFYETCDWFVEDIQKTERFVIAQTKRDMKTNAEIAKQRMDSHPYNCKCKLCRPIGREHRPYNVECTMAYLELPSDIEDTSPLTGWQKTIDLQDWQKAEPSPKYWTDEAIKPCMLEAYVDYTRVNDKKSGSHRRYKKIDESVEEQNFIDGKTDYLVLENKSSKYFHASGKIGVNMPTRIVDKPSKEQLEKEIVTTCRNKRYRYCVMDPEIGCVNCGREVEESS